MRHLEALYTTPQTPPPQVTPLLVAPREAAKILAICERTLFALTKAGDIPAVRIGRAVRYSVDDLRGWIKKQCGDSQNGA